MATVIIGVHLRSTAAPQAITCNAVALGSALARLVRKGPLGTVICMGYKRKKMPKHRTGDLQIFSLTLSQLSYRGCCSCLLALAIVMDSALADGCDVICPRSMGHGAMAESRFAIEFEQ